MRILTRYILKEIASHALIGVALFTFIIFMRDLGKLLELIVRNSAPLPSVAEIFLFTLPATFTITLPMGVLVGILVGLSRLAADSEVTAIRASGMGVGMFVRSVAIFAIGAWLLGMANSIYVAPNSAIALDHLQERLKASQASFEIQPRVFYEDFKNIVLYVQDAIPTKGKALWRGIFLADVSDPASPKITLAQRGALLSDGPNKLRFHLEDGTQQETIPKVKDQYSITTFENTEIPLALPSDETKPHDLLPVAELDLHSLLANAKRERAAAQTYYPWDMGSYNYDLIKARYYEIEFHRRFALPTACLVLAMVGIPLGLSARKGGKSTGFVLTILLVVVYYFFSLLGVQMARQGRMSPWFGSWMGNIFFFLCGLFLLWRVDRMPLEIGNLTAGWKTLLQKLQTIGTRRREFAASASYTSPSHRRRFSARFPLILDDMILRDFALYLTMIMSTFLILALVFTFFELLTDIVRNRVPLITVAEYLWNLSPSMIYLMAPMGVLLAVLITFGLLEKSSELTAMKATGFSIYRATVPVIVLSATFAAGLFVFDQLYIPHTNREQEILRNEIKGKPAQTYLQADRKWIFGDNNNIYYYRVFDPDQNTFGGLSIFEFDENTFQLTRRIHAERAYWDPRLQKWVLEQGWVRSLKGASIEDYHTFEVTTFNELREDPSYFKKEVKQSSEMNYDELRRYIDDLQQSGFDTIRLKVQLQKKIAFPLITLVMAILAIPFSASGRRGGALVGVAVALGIAVVYWVTAGLFEAMGDANQLPAVIAAWAPDFIFAFAGGYMLLRVPT
ncbi:MAG TPA: LPS export ABC transporter permease LptF [Verrucomicrobiae bacterium]|nr:LPS export ABC transporter permease LptF [Verrucomicrobiae bacterium]